MALYATKGPDCNGDGGCGGGWVGGGSLMHGSPAFTGGFLTSL